MRVLESKTTGLEIAMGKRKHKLRKQKEDSRAFGSESSDEATSGRGCPHVSKAVNLNTVRKALKQNPVIGECVECREDGTIPMQVNDNGASGGSDESASNSSIWFCLQCAHQGCGRDTDHKHALKHYATPRSSSHAIVININNRMIWCYDCDDEVLSTSSGKLHECVEYVCKQMGAGSRADGPQASQLNRSGSQRSAGDPSEAQVNNSTMQASDESRKSKKAVDAVRELKQPKAGGSVAVMQSLTHALPKVRGLSNLGNTCFFNAVMQNMSQTHILGELLEEYSSKDVNLKLPGQQRSSDGEEDGRSTEENTSEEDEIDSRIHLDPLTIKLGEIGALTLSMLDFFRDMNGASRNGTLSPNGLFNQVCKKVPRFKGYQQQDSHELLRHLLDGMKAEEIRRRQQGILKEFDLGDTWKRKKILDDTKMKIKMYGRQAKHTFVDMVFGGHFISTVLCEDCKTPSQIFEPFLDISLPITEEKTVRPNSQWGSRQKKDRAGSSGNAADNEVDVSIKSAGLSKHALKKSKKQLKREARKKKGPLEREDSTEQKTEGDEKKSEVNDAGAEESKESEDSKKSDEAQSDADVEDNVEGPSLSRQASTEHREGVNDPGSMCSSSEDSTVKGSLGPTSSDVSSTRTKVGTEEASTCHSETSVCCCSSTEDVSTLADGLRTAVRLVDEGRAGGQREARLRAMASLAPRYQPVSQECSVMSCLNQFTAPELLTGSNKFGCAACGRQKGGSSGAAVLTNASKQLLVLQPPPILTLHLKRFQQTGFSLRKVNRHVEFPMLLDLAPYCSALCQGIRPGQTSVLYALYGVVEHSGRLTGGHYTAYVKVRPNAQQHRDFLQNACSIINIDRLVQTMHSLSMPCESKQHEAEDLKPPPGKWYYISDSRVQEVMHESNILRCQAYLLFYERIY